ncbi:MAG: prolipoprotein diacylglyceryl transferase [Pirellulales bacterium]|nr:prolipoprotein diacylglyceryl transferase [Pirellulales bacterium]
MFTTLFHIPPEAFGIPLFGFGLFFYVWLVASLGFLGWLASKQGFTADTFAYLPILLGIGAFIVYIVPAMSDADGLAIRGYGAVLVLAVVLAVYLSARRARQMGVDPELIYGASFWLFVCGIIGARLFYVIQYRDQFRGVDFRDTLFQLINVSQGGLVVYGSLIGGGAALAWFIWRHKLPPLATVDLFTPSVILGMGIGRLGCFLNGCCFGGPSDLPWAVCFPQGSPPYMRQLQEGELYLHGLKFQEPISAPPVIAAVEPDSLAARAGLHAGQQIDAINGKPVDNVRDAEIVLLDVDKPGETLDISIVGESKIHEWSIADRGWSMPVQPTQIYSAIDALLLAFFLTVYYPFRRRDGELLALALTCHGITRFLLEVIRTDESAIGGTGLTISQNISLGVLVGAAGLWFYISQQPKGSVLPERAWLFARYRAS